MVYYCTYIYYSTGADFTMKISNMIEHLKYSMKTYGDNDVKIYFSDSKKNTIEFERIFFSDDMDEDKTTLSIQNFPYWKFIRRWINGRNNR